MNNLQNATLEATNSIFTKIASGEIKRQNGTAHKVNNKVAVNYLLEKDGEIIGLEQQVISEDATYLEYAWVEDAEGDVISSAVLRDRQVIESDDIVVFKVYSYYSHYLKLGLDSSDPSTHHIILNKDWAHKILGEEAAQLCNEAYDIKYVKKHNKISKFPINDESEVYAFDVDLPARTVNRIAFCVSSAELVY